MYSSISNHYCYNYNITYHYHHNITYHYNIITTNTYVITNNTRIKRFLFTNRKSTEIPFNNDANPDVPVDTVINTNGDGTSNYIMTDHHLIPIVELKEVKIVNYSDAIEPDKSYGEEVLRRNIHDKDYSNTDNIYDDDDDDDDEKYVVVNAIEVMESNQRVHPHDYNIEDDNNHILMII